MIAKSFSLVKFSSLCVIVNAHLLAGAAMHECIATCLQLLVLFNALVDFTSMHVLEQFTEIFCAINSLDQKIIKCAVLFIVLKHECHGF